MEVTSIAFRNGENIPKKYTCEGEDMNPPLAINDAPMSTKSFALIVDDPDAPTGIWVHWVVWNIKPEIREIPEAAKQIGVEGITDFRRAGYDGPCPPPGKPHRYFFKLYALDIILDLASNATKSQLEKSMKGYILAKAELMGTYQR